MWAAVKLEFKGILSSTDIAAREGVLCSKCYCFSVDVFTNISEHQQEDDQQDHPARDDLWGDEECQP